MMLAPCTPLAPFYLQNPSIDWAAEPALTVARHWTTNTLSYMLLAQAHMQKSLHCWTSKTPCFAGVSL